MPLFSVAFLRAANPFGSLELDAPVHQAGELAAVVDPVSGRRIGQLAGRNEIAAPDFRRIHADHVRRVLDQALHEIGGLGATGTAIGPALRSVGEQALRHDVHGLDVVGLGHEPQREGAGGESRVDEIGAHLEQALAAQGKYLAVLVERELAVIDHLAPVVVGLHAFAAARDPFHRPMQLARGPHHQRVVRKHARP